MTPALPLPYDVLVLCTSNSARSILAEYLLRAKGQGRFRVWSAGSEPSGRVKPIALRVLAEHYGMDAQAARSKSWDEFRHHPFHVVITVCDQAQTRCPRWPGSPVVLHWNIPPASATVGDADAKFRAYLAVAELIDQHVTTFCAPPTPLR